MYNQIEETVKIFDSQEKWEHYLSFCILRESISNYMFKTLFDVIENKFEKLIQLYPMWNFKRVKETDLRLFLNTSNSNGITICFDKSKETEYNFCFCIWCGGEFNWKAIADDKAKLETLRSLNILKNDGNKNEYLIFEDISKSLFQKTYKGDEFAYLCFNESDKIAEYVQRKLEIFMSDDSKINTFIKLNEENKIIRSK